MRNSEPLEFEVVVIHKTDYSLLIVREEDFEERWLKGERVPEGTGHFIPYSQINEESEITEDSEKGDSGVLVIPAWLAEEKEL